MSLSIYVTVWIVFGIFLTWFLKYKNKEEPLLRCFVGSILISFGWIIVIPAMILASLFDFADKLMEGK